MRYCGIDVSARPGQQQLCTLHPRRGADGDSELVATFYEPGDVTAVARTVLGFGRAGTQERTAQGPTYGELMDSFDPALVSLLVPGMVLR